MHHAQWQIDIAQVNIVKCPSMNIVVVTVVLLPPTNAVSAVPCNFIICGNARMASRESRSVIVCVSDIKIQLLMCKSSEENIQKSTRHLPFIEFCRDDATLFRSRPM